MALSVRFVFFIGFVAANKTYLDEVVEHETPCIEGEDCTPIEFHMVQKAARTKRAVARHAVIVNKHATVTVPAGHPFRGTSLGRNDEESGKNEKHWGSENWPNWPTTENLPVSVDMSKYVPSRPIRMFEWTLWNFYPWEPELRALGMKHCHIEGSDAPRESNVIRDRDFPIDQYDVILFHLPMLMANYPDNYVLPRRKLPGQLWIAMCGEPMRSAGTVDCRLVNDTETMALMDGYSSYSEASDFPAVQDPCVEEVLRLPVPDFASHGSEIASLAVSDAQNPERNDFVLKLTHALEQRNHKVFSYGGWQKNADEPNCTGQEGTVDSWRRRDGYWINRCAARPFKIVSEQVWEAGYVTEKVWDALGEGTIPVYWGAEDVKRWVPPGSILHFADFGTIEALADKMAGFTAEDFAAAYAWKSRPTSEWGGWADAWKLSHTTIVPRLCKEAANRFPSPRLPHYPPDVGIEAPDVHKLPPSLQQCPGC